MKRLLCILMAVLMLAGCTAAPAQTSDPVESASPEDFEAKWSDSGYVRIRLNENEVTVTGTDDTSAVVTGNDIVYYEEGHDFTYGEGTEADAHSAEEAGKHTVVTITQPGTYVLTGSMSAGQIAVDLGDEAEEDPNAVVTLILDNVNLICTVAPAVIFYNVYECGDKDNPSATVDTSAAGANVILADGSVNNIIGSYVARIYKPDSVVLSEDGTEVEDSKKLHKYDAAFYSKMSMNVSGNDGVLNISAENEGLDSELHLTINGGEINIVSGNDGINTNEDGVSVTTINGGKLNIQVAGTTGEGDGIDSNGWLVINGGEVYASACAISGDAGIDSDMGIYLNGGTVCATGNMLDRIEDNSQTHAVFTFAEAQKAGTYTLKNANGETVLEFTPENNFQYLIFSSPDLAEGTYTLWSGETQFQGSVGGFGMGGGMGGGMIGQIERPEFPDDPPDVEIPPQPTTPIVTQGEKQQPVTDGESPEAMPVPVMPEGDPSQMPTPDMSEQSEQMPIPEMPDGVEPPADDRGGGRRPGGNMDVFVGALSTDFPISEGANYFSNVTAVE